MRVVTFKIEEYLLERIDSYAVNNNLDRSSLIRMALKEYLENHEDKKEYRLKVEKLFKF